MRKPLAVVALVVVSFGLGMLVTGGMGAPGADDADPGDWEPDIPAAATKLWFPPVDQYHNEGEPLSDESFEALMAALETAMTAEETLADFDRAIALDPDYWPAYRHRSVVHHLLGNSEASYRDFLRARELQ